MVRSYRLAKTSFIGVFCLTLICSGSNLWSTWQTKGQPKPSSKTDSTVTDQSNQLPWRKNTTVNRQQLNSSQVNRQQAAAPMQAQPDRAVVQAIGNIVNDQPNRLQDIVPASFLLEQEFANGQQQDQTANPDQGSNEGSAINRQLPNTAGQVWREYDIRPYTSQISTTHSPQQAVVDWILRETGNEMWFNEPLGILSASRNRLRVYHTPEIQSVVKRIVDQLVSSRGQVQIMGLKLVTVGNPNWRTTAFKMLQPIRVQSPGVQGWMMSKENAAILYGQLRHRGDFRMIKNGNVSIHDGQKLSVSQLRPINYYSSIQPVTNRYGLTQWQPVASRIQEGFTLEIGALTSSDQRTVESVLTCQIDQVEKLQPVRIELPVQGSNPQSVELQVPQLISWRLKERFRWPSDQVLVLSCGVIATPNPDGNGGADLGKFLNQSRGRADALLFVEYKGPAQVGRVPNQRQPAGATANRDGGLRPVGPRR